MCRFFKRKPSNRELLERILAKQEEIMSTVQDLIQAAQDEGAKVVALQQAIITQGTAVTNEIKRVEDVISGLKSAGPSITQDQVDALVGQLQTSKSNLATAVEQLTSTQAELDAEQPTTPAPAN